MINRTRQPSYRLTRAGLFAITSSLVSRSYLEERSHGLLIWYFLKSYAKQIKDNMLSAGSDFSRAHQIEMEQLLDTERFANRQIQFAEQEIQRLKARINAAELIEKTASKLKASGLTLEQRIEVIAERFPYELTPQRSFKETLKRLRAQVSEWEIGIGSLLRAEVIFIPLLKDLKEYSAKMRAIKAT